MNIQGKELKIALSVSSNISSSFIEVNPPSPVSFDTTRTGSAKQLIFTITNPSTAVLQIDSVWTDTKYFNVMRMLEPEQIRKGDTAKVTIRFTPDSLMRYYGTLFIANNSPVSPYTVQLYGDGIDSLTEFINNNWRSIQANLSGIDTFSISAPSALDCSIARLRFYAPWGVDLISKLRHPSYYYSSDFFLTFTCTSIPPVHFNAHEPVVTFVFTEKPVNSSSVTIEYEFADINGKLLNIDFLVSDSLLLSRSDGISVYHILPTSVSRNGNIPLKFELKQNYPNPFNPTTTISFSLPSKSYVTLKVFDLLGKEVYSFISEELPAGIYERQWCANALSSGVYFCRIQAGSFSDTKKLILLR